MSALHVHPLCQRSWIWNLGKKKPRNLHPVIGGLLRVFPLKMCGWRAVSSY